MNENFKEFSVLMAIYDKNDPEELREALKTVFDNTILPKQCIIVEDGPINKILKNVINTFQKKYPGVIETISIARNCGLGSALSEGQKYIKCPYVARVDSDDLNEAERFEKQLEVLESDSSIGMVGSYIQEFEDDARLDFRVVPIEHREIFKYAKYKSPMNHMTVMIRTEVLEETGGYRDMLLFEDYDLWLRILHTDWQCRNISEPLVKARISSKMFKRRGGFKYLLCYLKFRVDALKNKRINFWHFISMAFIHSTVIMMPNSLRSNIYSTFLRKTSV